MRLAIVACTVVLASVADASTADVFGFGSEESAVCGASTARVHDFSAAFYNPAGFTAIRSAEATIGFFAGGATLQATSLPRFHLSDSVALVVGGGAPIPFGGVLQDRIYFGIALSILPDKLLRLSAHQSSTPFFPLYDNRTQRLMVVPAIAVRLPRGVSIGIAFNLLAGLEGQVASREGATRAIEARVDEQVSTQLAVHVGAKLEVTRALTLGLTYRQAFRVPFHTVSDNTIGGQPINLDVAASGLFTPDEVVLGAAYNWRAFLWSLDVAWAHWSAWEGPYVGVDSLLPKVDSVIHAPPPKINFRDTGSVRIGMQWRAFERGRGSLLLRGGYGFESSPVPAQQSTTVLLDGNKHRLAIGFGVNLRFAAASMSIDAHGQVDALQPKTFVNTAGSLSASGAAYGGGITVTVRR